MLKKSWQFIAIVAASMIVAVIGALALYPEKPNLAGNAGFQEQAANYRVGGTDCQPEVTDREPARRAIACKEAEEEHRLKANDLIQQRRSADAADAMAILSLQQTRIAAWGIALGAITMAAAIAAAYFAKRAAEETKRSADAFQPHLHVSLLYSNLGQYLAGNSSQAIFKFEIINAGGGPGRITQANVNLTIAHSAGGQGHDIGAKIEPIIFPAGMVEKFETNATNQIAAIADDLRHYFKKNSPMVGTTSHVRYVDAAGKEHVSSENWRIFHKDDVKDDLKSEGLSSNFYI